MSQPPRKTFAPKIPSKKKKKKKKVVKTEATAEGGPAPPAASNSATGTAASVDPLSSASTASAASSSSAATRGGATLSKTPGRGRSSRGKRPGSGRGRSRQRRDQYTNKGEGIFSHGFRTGQAAASSKAGLSRSARSGSGLGAIASTPSSGRRQGGSSLVSLTTHDDELDITAEERPHEGPWYQSTDPQSRPTFLPLGTTTMEDEKDYSTPVELPDAKPNLAALNLSDEERATLQATGSDTFVDGQTKPPELLFFQFPDPLPFEPPSSLPPEVKQEESHMEEKPSGNRDKSSQRANLATLPGGRLGKLRVYKSGRMEIVLGGVRFDLSEGTKSTFAQEVVALDPNSKHPTSVCLGSLRKRYAAIPDVEQLLARTTL